MIRLVVALTMLALFAPLSAETQKLMVTPGGSRAIRPGSPMESVKDERYKGSPASPRATQPTPSPSEAASEQPLADQPQAAPRTSCEMLEQLVNSSKSRRLTTDDTIGELLNHPAFADFGRLLLPWDDRRYDNGMRLRNVGSLLPYHSYVDPGTVVNASRRNHCCARS